MEQLFYDCNKQCQENLVHKCFFFLFFCCGAGLPTANIIQAKKIREFNHHCLAKIRSQLKLHLNMNQTESLFFYSFQEEVVSPGHFSSWNASDIRGGRSRLSNLCCLPTNTQKKVPHIFQDDLFHGFAQFWEFTHLIFFHFSCSSFFFPLLFWGGVGTNKPKQTS